MVVHAFVPSRKVSEVKAHMFYRASSRAGYATWRNSVWGERVEGRSPIETDYTNVSWNIDIHMY